MEVAFPRGSSRPEKASKFGESLKQFGRKAGKSPSEFYGKSDRLGISSSSIKIKKKKNEIGKINGKGVDYLNGYNYDNDEDNRPSEPLPVQQLWVSRLTPEVCVPDLLVLGCVQNITPIHVFLELPDGVIAILPSENVSQLLSDQLNEGSKTKLKDLFVRGQFICCKISKAIPIEHTDKKNLQVTTDPTVVNSSIATTDLTKGMALNGVIKSREDKGYMVDFCLPDASSDLIGFMPFEKSNQEQFSEKKLKIGQVVYCIITKSPSTARNSTRVIEVSSLLEDLHWDFTKRSVRKEQLLPGLTLRAVVIKVEKRGLLVRFAAKNDNGDKIGAQVISIGFVRDNKLLYPDTKPTDYRLEQQIRVTILYSMANASIFGLSARSHLVEDFNDHIISGVSIGDSVLGTVKDVTPIGVLFEIDARRHLFARVSRERMDAETDDDVDKLFKIGATQKLRLVNYSMVDRVFVGDVRKVTMKAKCVSAESAVPGTAVEGVMKRFHKRGLIVRLYGLVNALVPWAHCSDGNLKLEDIQAKYKADQPVKGQILYSEARANRVVMTLKKQLIKSKLLRITELNEGYVDEATIGFVVVIAQHGIYVEFYNRIRGYISRNELVQNGIVEEPATAFYEGQVIRVTVTAVNKEKRLYVLRPSFAASSVETSAAANDTKSFTAKIINKDDLGLHVKIPFGDAIGLIPVAHLTDSFTGAQELMKAYKIGDTIGPLAIFTGGITPIVTAKPAIVKALEDDVYPRNILTMKVGQLLPGVVSKVHEEHGYYVTFPNSITALAMVNSIDKPFELPPLMVGQTVVASVQTVNAKEGRCRINLKLSKCMQKKLNTDIHLLTQYLSERKRLAVAWSKQSDKERDLSETFVGKVMQVTVQNVSEIGLVALSKDGLKGIATSDQMGMSWMDYKIGAKYDAVVLFVDFAARCVELSFRSNILKKCYAIADKIVGKVDLGTIVQAEILQVKTDAILTVLMVNDVFYLGYIPGRLHYNDRGQIAGQRRYKVGAKVEAKVIQLSGKYLILADLYDVSGKQTSINAKGGTTGERRDPFMEGGEFSYLVDELDSHTGVKLIVGQVYNAVIESVCPLMMNVLIEGSVKGKIHASELSDDVKHMSMPMENYADKKRLRVMFIGWSSSSLNETEDAEDRIAHCTLKPSKMKATDVPTETLQYKRLFAAGDDEVVFIERTERDYYIVTVNPFVKGIIFPKRLTDDKNVLADLDSYFPPGTALRATVYHTRKAVPHLEFACLEKDKIHRNEEITVEVMSINIRAMVVACAMPNGQVGFLHITDMDDDYSKAAEKYFSIAEQQQLKVCAVSKGRDWRLSMRKSHLLKKNSDDIVVDPSVSGATNIAVGAVMRGFVRLVRDTYIIVTLGPDVGGMVTNAQVYENDFPRLTEKFSVGDLVTVKVLSNESKDKIELSMLPSDIGSAIETHRKQVKRKADVNKETLPTPKKRAKDVLEENQNANDAAKRNQDASIAVKQEKNTPAGKKKNRDSSVLVETTLGNGVASVQDEGATVVGKKSRGLNASVEKTPKKNVVAKEKENATESKKTPKKRAAANENKNTTDGKKTSKKKVAAEIKPELDEPSDDELSVSDLSDSEPESEPELEPNVKARTKVDFNNKPGPAIEVGFSWNPGRFSMANLMDMCLEGSAKPSNSMKDNDGEDDDDTTENAKTTVNHKQLTKREREKAEENSLLEKEMAMLNPDFKPESQNEFGRLLMGQPNSSELWIRYMAHYIQSGDIGKARAVAARALKTINFKEQKERFNVWVAVLNLENCYGTKEALRAVFDRAIKYNEPIEMYKQMARINYNAKKVQDNDELYVEMLRKFKSDLNTWVSAGEHYMSSGRPEVTRELMERSLKSIPKADHCHLISRFATLEYRFSPDSRGDAERGRTMFENIIKDYPKKMDIWSIYIDLTIKYRTPDEVRPLFERVTSSKLNAHKLRPFYKKWEAFEEKHGNKGTRAQVKSRMAEFVKKAVGEMGNDQKDGVADEDGDQNEVNGTVENVDDGF